MNDRWTWLLFVGLLSCGGSSRRNPFPEMAQPVSIRSPGEMSVDFHWRQVVRVSYSGHPSRSFDAVLQKIGDSLKLVGLTPLGHVTFVAEALGTQVRFENRTGEPLPFDGSYILLDVERAFFPWLTGPARNGWRTGRWGEEVVRERLVDGEVVERRFETQGSTHARVSFLEAGQGEAPPPRVVLENLRFGYKLDIQTIEP